MISIRSTSTSLMGKWWLGHQSKWMKMTFPQIYVPQGTSSANICIYLFDVIKLHYRVIIAPRKWHFRSSSVRSQQMGAHVSLFLSCVVCLCKREIERGGILWPLKCINKEKTLTCRGQREGKKFKDFDIFFIFLFFYTTYHMLIR